MNKVLACAIMGLASMSVSAEDASVLSRQELERCADQLVSLQAQAEHVGSVNSRLATQRARIDREKQAIASARASVDRNDEAAFQTFQERQARHRTEVRLFNAEAAQLNDDAVALSESNRRYTQACATRNYRRKDLESLPPAKRTAMRSGDVVLPQVDANGR